MNNRNAIRTLYKNLLKPVLFRLDPEFVHNVFVGLGEALGQRAAGRRLVERIYGYDGPDAAVILDGLRYETPVVLAAGFDYNGRLTGILKSVGFGGVEVGSVTARACPGNQPPRLQRLPESQSLIVNKGLRNDGVEVVARRLRERWRPDGFVVGVSIARTNDEQSAGMEAGIEDYATSLRHLVETGVGDYYTINISCPNVHGGESFSVPDRLEPLLERLAEIRHARPMYAKMPINRNIDDFDGLLELLDRYGYNGVIIGNLNKDYDELEVPEEAPDEYQGGLSGAPTFDRSNELIRHTRDRYADRFTIIGCGGVMSAEDALEKFRAGADLIQMISGMIFEGPHLMGEIAKTFAEQQASVTVLSARV